MLELKKFGFSLSLWRDMSCEGGWVFCCGAKVFDLICVLWLGAACCAAAYRAFSRHLLKRNVDCAGGDDIAKADKQKEERDWAGARKTVARSSSCPSSLSCVLL